MLADKIRELIDAGFSGLWIQSAEPDEAIAEIRQLASAEGYTIHGTDEAGELTTAPDGDPLAALASLATLETDAPTLLLLPNFASYLADPAIKQTVFRAIQKGKKSRQAEPKRRALNRKTDLD